MRKKHPPPEASRPQQLLHPGCLAFATALAVSAPLVPSERTEMTGAALPQVMLWLLLALVWFGGAWLARVPVRRFEVVDYVAIAFAGWIALSGLVMMHSGAPRPTINAIWTWVSMIAAFLLLRQLLRDEREVRALCAVMIGLAVCLSVIAIHQTFVAHPQMRELYKSDPDEALRRASVSAPPGTVQRKQFEDRLNSTEPNATFSLTNSLAGFIAPWLVVLVAVASSRRAPSQQTRTSRRLEATATWPVAALLAVCLLLTKSRSAWLATLLGVFGIALELWTIAGGQRPATSQRLAVLGTIAALVAAIALLAGIGILDIEILAQAWRSLAFRLEYWQATLAMIADFPLLGIGPGNFQEYYTAHKLPQASETIADPHNFLLEIAAIAGVPALLVFLALLVFAAVSAGTGEREAPASLHSSAGALPSQRAIYAGGFGGIPLAFLLGLVTGFMPDALPLLLGAGGGSLAVWLLLDWVERGALPRWIMMLSIAVLLVNLLAAGGIGFPGVAITLWVLLASIFSIAGGQRPAASPLPAGDSKHGRPAAMIAAMLLLACYATAYQPVLARMRLSLAVGDAQTAGRIGEAIQLSEGAAAADPWSAESRLQLAQLHFEKWMSRRGTANTDDADFLAFERHAAAAIARNQRAYPIYAAIGYLQAEAARKLGERHALDKALRLVAQSVALYPSDALGRAQFAWLLAEAGRTRDARREAAEALRLDELCPHAERKLAQRRLFAEVTSVAQQARMPDELRTLTAEQWMHRLRKNSR